MKVKELIGVLNSFDPDREVHISPNLPDIHESFDIDEFAAVDDQGNRSELIIIVAGKETNMKMKFLED